MSSAVLERLRGLLVGGPKNLLDPRIHHSLALIAFFAWVGLGSDGLSSSCYGPEQAFLQLGPHRHLVLFLAIAIIATVFLISASYSYIIELFPSGGGGYLVATKLLGPVPGVVSGGALVVDYVFFVLIKNPISLSPHDFYIGQSPWIYLIYVAILISPLCCMTLTRLLSREALN